MTINLIISVVCGDHLSFERIYIATFLRGLLEWKVGIIFSIYRPLQRGRKQEKSEGAYELANMPELSSSIF